MKIVYIITKCIFYNVFKGFSTGFVYSCPNFTKSLLATKNQEAGGRHFLFDKTCKHTFYVHDFIKYKVRLLMCYGRVCRIVTSPFFHFIFRLLFYDCTSLYQPVDGTVESFSSSGQSTSIWHSHYSPEPPSTYICVFYFEHVNTNYEHTTLNMHVMVWNHSAQKAFRY